MWAAICLLLHSFALCRLLLDERPIHFKSEDEEQLWRFFYRRAGMGRLEFKQVGWRSCAGDFVCLCRCLSGVGRVGEGDEFEWVEPRSSRVE